MGLLWDYSRIDSMLYMKDEIFSKSKLQLSSKTQTFDTHTHFNYANVIIPVL